MESEDNIGFQIIEELLGIKEQLEDFNNLHLDKILIQFSEMNRYLQKITNSLELMAKG